MCMCKTAPGQDADIDDQDVASLKSSSNSPLPDVALVQIDAG